MAENHHPDRKAATPRLPGARWLAPLLLALVVIGFYWKLVLTNQFTWLASDDLSAQVLPWFQFQASEWHAGRFPLWDPYSWAGQPLLAQAQPGAAYPLNWLVFLAPLKHTWLRQAVLHWYYVLIRILTALAFFWFCRDLGRSRTASFIGGSVYGLAGFVGTVGWPQIVSAAIWAPLVFLFQFRAARGLRPVANSVLSGFFLGVCWLCGHHQVPIFLSLAMIFLWLYFIASQPARRENARSLILTVLSAILTGGVQTLPTAEYGRLAVRWAAFEHPLHWTEIVPYAIHEKFSFKPLSLLSIVVPGADLNVNPLIGAVAFSLAVAGLFLAWRRDPRARWLAALALGSLVYSLGPDSIVNGILYAAVPMLEKARVPAHALLLFHIGICALAAWGVDLFPALTRRGAALVSLALAGLATLLAATGLVLYLARILPLNGDTRFMVTALAAFCAAALLWAFWNRFIGRTTAFAALLLLILLEAGTVSGYDFASYYQKDRTANLVKMSQDADVVEYLRNQPGQPFRIEYDTEAVPHNFGDWWGIETFTSYVPSAPDIVMRNDPYSPRTQALLGVRYYFGTKPLRPDQQLVFTAASGRKLYRNPDSFPRAWAVHHVTPRPDPNLKFAGEATVAAADLPSLESCSGDSVRVRQHLPNQVTLDADMRCRGLVILSETSFPGWTATVDGVSRPILTADGFLRGVVVDGGKHVVTLRYRPRSLILGALMTFLGALSALLAGIFPRLFGSTRFVAPSDPRC
jgi:hypothetical protein